MIIGSKKDNLEDIVRDMEKHMSLELKTAIKNNIHESRKDWIIWMMERAGKKNARRCLMENCSIYIKTRCRQVLLQEKKIGSIAVQEIFAE